jgi:hypothetical protein
MKSFCSVKGFAFFLNCLMMLAFCSQNKFSGNSKTKSSSENAESTSAEAKVKDSIQKQTSYAVKGKVIGLESDKVELSLIDPSESLIISKDGVFSFKTKVPNSHSVQIKVKAYPSNHSCTAKNSEGKVQDKDFDSYELVCQEEKPSTGKILPPSKIDIVWIASPTQFDEEGGPANLKIHDIIGRFVREIDRTLDVRFLLVGPSNATSGLRYNYGLTPSALAKGFKFLPLNFNSNSGTGVLNVLLCESFSVSFSDGYCGFMESKDYPFEDSFPEKILRSFFRSDALPVFIQSGDDMSIGSYSSYVQFVTKMLNGIPFVGFGLHQIGNGVGGGRGGPEMVRFNKESGGKSFDVFDQSLTHSDMIQAIDKARQEFFFLERVPNFIYSTKINNISINPTDYVILGKVLHLKKEIIGSKTLFIDFE